MTTALNRLCKTCRKPRTAKEVPWGDTAGETIRKWVCEQCTGAPVETQPFKKADAEKVRMDLLPPRALLAVGRVLTFGARKYSPGNWRNLPADERHRYVAAAFRHLVAIMRGEAVDAESGESHWAHLVCCGMFMLEFHEEET